jgi:hypothetical protein
MSVNSGIAMHTSTHLSHNLPITGWTPEEKSFSANYVINAFLEGKEAGRNENQRILIEKFESNLNLAGKATEELLEDLNKLKVSVLDIRLKPEQVTIFSIILVIVENDYVTEGFLIAYSKVREIKNKYSSDTLYISFSFMPSTPNFNEACLISDGYSWKYAKIKGKTGSRAA